MAVETGNSSSAAFTGTGAWTDFNTALLVLGIDFGEQTRETLPYVPLKNPASGDQSGEAREFHHPGDFATMPQWSLNGLLDPVEVDKLPFETKIVQTCTVSLPTASNTRKDDGTFVTITGPNLVNNELMEVTCVFQTNGFGASRGWVVPGP